MLYKSLAIVAAAAGVVSGAEWAIVPGTKSATLVGVGAASSSLAVGAASDNNVGGELELYNGATWTKYASNTGLNMDAAVTSAGVSVESSMWPIVVFDGTEHTVAEDVHGLSQSVSTDGNSFFGLVGTFVYANTTSSVNGVAYSRDAGSTFSVSSPVPNGYARYGAFPSSDTWYVSCGMWGDEPSQLKGSSHAISKHVQLHNNKLSIAPSKRSDTDDSTTGWFGSIEKTTDGGATWTTVFRSDASTDYYYFNSIACSNTERCIAAAEGYAADGSYLVKGFMTEDGGKTWEVTLETSEVSLMGAAWESDTVGWLSGTTIGAKRELIGMFYRTSDGGKTWEAPLQLDDCFAMDIDFADGVGFASCASSSGSSSSMAMYK